MPSRRKKKNDPPRKKAAVLRPSRPLRKPVSKKISKLKKTVLKVKSSIKTVIPRAVSAASTHPHPDKPVWEDRRLPSHYGDDRLALLVRDPWWLFAYWEVTPHRQEEVLAQMGDAAGSGRKMVLRVYDVTGGLTLPRSNSFFDIELNFYADNWYIDVGLPDREWVTELGYRVGGRFFPLLRSNRVQTPAFGISDVLDEEWMLPEDIYYRLLGRSIGAERAGSSMDIRKLLEKYLRNVVSSKVQHLGVPTS